MSDDPQGTVTGQTGQATTDPAPAATTGTAPAASSGQPAGQQTTTPQTGTDADDAFFDPRDLDPALQPAYKNMQKAFSKKMEAIKADRQKIDAYRALEQDPVGTLTRMAQQLGLQVGPAGQPAPQTNEPWQPQTWDDVIKMAETRAEQKLLEKFQPLIQEVSSMKKNNIEKLLDDNCPDWRQHEDDMMANLRKHPSLVNDPAALYRMSVPPEVLESRATQAALKKLQAKAQGAQVSGTSTTNKTQVQLPSGPMTFSQAVEAAKKKLAADGIRRPAEG